MEQTTNPEARQLIQDRFLFSVKESIVVIAFFAPGVNNSRCSETLFLRVKAYCAQFSKDAVKELEDYTIYAHPTSPNRDLDHAGYVKWIFEHLRKYRALRGVVLACVNVCPTEATVERTFKDMKTAVKDWRVSLGSDTVSSILIAKSCYEFAAHVERHQLRGDRSAYSDRPTGGAPKKTHRSESRAVAPEPSPAPRTPEQTQSDQLDVDADGVDGDSAPPDDDLVSDEDDAFDPVEEVDWFTVNTEIFNAIIDHQELLISSGEASPAANVVVPTSRGTRQTADRCVFCTLVCKNHPVPPGTELLGISHVNAFVECETASCTKRVSLAHIGHGFNFPMRMFADVNEVAQKHAHAVDKNENKVRWKCSDCMVLS